MLKVPESLWLEFNQKWEAKAWPELRFGQAWVNYLRAEGRTFAYTPQELSSKIFNAQHPPGARKLIYANTEWTYSGQE